jgi:YggT family protein
MRRQYDRASLDARDVCRRCQFVSYERQRSRLNTVFVWTNLVIWIASVLQGILWLYFWVVIISAIMTWIEPNPYNPIVRFIYSVTEPVFDFIREHLPVIFGGIDFSPLIVIIGIEFFQSYLIPTLTRILVFGFT